MTYIDVDHTRSTMMFRGAGVATIALISSLGASAQNIDLAKSLSNDPTAEFLENAKTELCASPATGGPETARTATDRGTANLECARKILLTIPSIGTTSTASVGKVSSAMQLAANSAEATEKKVKAAAATAEFLGFNWGLGIGYGFGMGPDRVDDAELVNGIVRVKADRTNGVRAVLEAHHFFDTKRDRTKADQRVGFGPFASVQLGKEGTSAVAFALGFMVGWKDAGDVQPSAGSWNIGVGYEFAQDVKVLGDGLVANQPLPVGETQLRYKTRSADAILIFFSRRFRMEGIQ